MAGKACIDITLTERTSSMITQDQNEHIHTLLMELIGVPDMLAEANAIADSCDNSDIEQVYDKAMENFTRYIYSLTE